MSFLKFWGSKKGSKKDDGDGKHGDPAALDPELEKRRLRHSLSISRSGRFKQRKRERSQIMDKPEIFDSSSSQSASTSGSSTNSSSASLAATTDNNRNNNSGGGGSGNSNSNNVNNNMTAMMAAGAHYHNNANSGNYRSSAAHAHQHSSPNFNCRNINSGNIGAAPGRMRMGHPVVT